MINILMLTSEADLRTEIALLRAQMGRQSNEPHGTESNTSQVCISIIVMAAINMLTLTFEADLRTETASFDRTQTGKQSYEPHGPAPTGSQVFSTTNSVTHDIYADAYLPG